MKLLLLLCSIVGLTIASVNDDALVPRASDDCPTQANMNPYTDYLMVQLGPFIRQHGWIPMALPDIVEQFEAKPIIITYKCELSLWSGELDRFDGCVRQGNAMMLYENLEWRIQIGWSLQNLHYRYDYRVVGMDWEFLSQDGWLEGGVDDFVMHCHFLIDIEKLYIYLEDFKVDRIGTVWTRLHGNIFTDWLANAVINTMTLIFRGTLADFISGQIKAQIEAGLDAINGRHYATAEEIQQSVYDLPFTFIKELQKK